MKFFLEFEKNYREKFIITDTCNQYYLLFGQFFGLVSWTNLKFEMKR